jgi:hypothetical protein
MKTSLLMLGAAFALNVTVANAAECPPNYTPYGPLCAAPGYDTTDPDKPAPTTDPDKPAPTRRITTQLFDTNGKRIGQMVQDGDVVSYFYVVPARPHIPQLSARTLWSRHPHLDPVAESDRQVEANRNVSPRLYADALQQDAHYQDWLVYKNSRNPLANPAVSAEPLVSGMDMEFNPWSPRALSTADVQRILDLPVVVEPAVWVAGTAPVPYTQPGLPFMSAYAPPNEFEAVNGNDPNANTVGKPGGIGSDYVASPPAEEQQQQTADCSLAATPELEAQCRGDEVVVAK